MPSGKTARPNITDNKDGTITVRYAPTEKGLHQMGIKYDGNHIPGELGSGHAVLGRRIWHPCQSCLPSLNKYLLRSCRVQMHVRL